MRTVALLALCALIFVAQASDNPDDLPFGTSWLGENERAEYARTVKSDRGRYLKGLYEQADPLKRDKIKAEVLPSCYKSWLPADELREIERLHVSGDHDACRAKVRALLNALPEAKREEVESYWELCAHLWYNEHAHNHHAKHKHQHHSSRRLRHVHNSFDTFAAEHLTWLSDAERTEVKNLHEESKEKGRDRVIEILEASSGEKRNKGIAELQAACRELIVEILGEDKATELRTLKETGATQEKLKAKVDELLDSVTDEKKKEKALDHKLVCEKVYGMPTGGSSRRRRAQHHELENKLRNEWSWLSDDQKSEIRNWKSDGKSDQFLLEKVFGYFKEAEDKETAERGLQTSCNAQILSILGPEKAEELKTFMANGARPEAYEEKVKSLLSSAPQKPLSTNQKSCKLLFTEASRRRRHETGEHHHHTLEEYLESHLSWLTDQQKEQVRQLKADGGDKGAIQKKVLEFYDAASGDQKDKATAALQAGCRELFAHLLGAEKTEELKKLKESGATKDELRKKGDEFVEALTDEKKKEEAKFYAVGCRKVFGVDEAKKRRHAHRASRHRRDHHEHSHESATEHEKHSLEDLFKTYLNWVPEAKQKELLADKEAGKSREELQKRVFEIFESLEGDAKTKAREQMQAGCRRLLVKVVGQEKADELKRMKETGSSTKEISEKAKEFVSAVTDEHHKKIVAEYKGVCSKVFETDA